MNPIRKKVICKDGVGVSVQASEHHYCSPRDNNGPYTEVELGYPTILPPYSWMVHQDGMENDPLDSVYAYVPVEKVREFLTLHGGMVDGELPPFVDKEPPVTLPHIIIKPRIKKDESAAKLLEDTVNAYLSSAKGRAKLEELTEKLIKDCVRAILYGESE